MLEKKGKVQKAANILYYCVVADSNNEELRRRWDGLIRATNTQQAGESRAGLGGMGMYLTTRVLLSTPLLHGGEASRHGAWGGQRC